jgi:SPP1 gp7 family putative phage head morphogenesis protein
VPWDVEVDFEGGFPLALAWFRGHVPMSEGEFGNLSARAREKAEQVAGVSQLDLAAEVWEALDKQIEEGGGLQAFVADIGELMAAAWGGEDPKRLETIFRTNVQTAYGAGRMLMQDDPAIREARPFRRFVAVLDDRTSDICEELNETTLPGEDPFWDDHQPPLHFNCRSTIVTLDEEQANDFGIDSFAPDVDAQEGFGDPLAHWEPDVSDKPAPLAAQFKLKPQPEPAPPPPEPGTPEPVAPPAPPAPPAPIEGPTFKPYDPNQPIEVPKPKRPRKPRAPKLVEPEPESREPRETPAEKAIADNLIKGTVLKQKHLGGGINETYIVEVQLEGTKRQGVWKPRKGESHARDNVRTGTYAFREEAASRVAQEIGYDAVPVTRRRMIEGQAGSIQLFKDGTEKYDKLRYAKTWDKVSKLEGEKFRAFDYLMGNTDRHTGNMLWKDGKPVLIDHGLSLPYRMDGMFNQDPKILDHYELQRGLGAQHVGDFSPEGKAWLKAIDSERVARALKISGVDSDATELALRRLEKLKGDQSFITSKDIRQPSPYERYIGRSQKSMAQASQGLDKATIDRLRATVVKIFSEPKTAGEP